MEYSSSALVYPDPRLRYSRKEIEQLDRGIVNNRLNRKRADNNDAAPSSGDE
jgi:hypothetical protein